jgi:hypothetical protein
MPEPEESDDADSPFDNLRKRLGRTFRYPEDDSEDKVSDIPQEDDSSPIEDYLASRLRQIGEIGPETIDLKGLRTGNGWDATQLVEQGYKIDPISLKRAVEVAISSNRTFTDRLLSKLRIRKPETRLIEDPVVEFVPIWKVRGFHECYYLRSNSYKVNVKEDVVGVEVEGKSRDLVLERKHRNFIPTIIRERLQRLSSFLSNESKYFVINKVTELARVKSESELVITWNGTKLSIDEELLLTSWRPKRIYDESDLKVRGADIRIRGPAISNEMILEKFREQLVHMPERFKQILSSKLQVTEFKRIYIPLIRVRLQKGLVPQEVIINGSSGQIADKQLLEILS